MIASLKGRVLRIEEEWVVLDVGGVGYQVHIHPRTAARLMGERGEVLLQVHTQVRDDAISLFGFLEVEELACFRQLLTVERIGPKAALAILARSEWPALVAAIQSGDHALLASVPGIGGRTAQRIVLELRGRVEELARPLAEPAPAPLGPVAERAQAALEALGFSATEARRALAEASAGEPGAADRTLEEVVKQALQRLGPRDRQRVS